MTRNIVFTAGCKTAMPTSWRAYDEGNVANDYECVILPQSSSRRRYYEVLTYGTHFGNYERLADAKAGIEEIYGPVNWTRVRLPLVEVEHYYFGKTTEFTDPLLVYAADLPRLGATAASAAISEADRRKFTLGQCGPLAVALHDATGWPIAVVADEEGDGSLPSWSHAGVVAPDGRFLDVEGFHTEDEVIRRWQFDDDSEPGDYWLTQVDADAFRAESLPEGVPVSEDLPRVLDAVLAAYVPGKRQGVATALAAKVEVEIQDIPHPAEPGNPDVRGVYAFVESQNVGHLLWWTKGPRRGEVWYVSVLPEYRRRGIATAMWDHVKAIEPALHHQAEQFRSPEAQEWSKHTSSVAEEQVLYHGTSRALAKEILRDGPRAGLNLTSNLDAARQYARYASGGSAWTEDKRKQGVVLEVRVRPEEVETGAYGADHHFVRDHAVTIVALPADRVREAQAVAKTAMPVGPPPSGLRYLMTWNNIGRVPATRAYCMLGAVLGGELVGYLTWGLQGRKVQSLWVKPEHRRRRIAETMFNLAKTQDPGIIHHPDRTDSGEAWVQFISPEEAERINNTTEGESDRPNLTLAGRLLEPRHPEEVIDLTPMAVAASKTAGANGDLPEGYTFEVKEEPQSERWGYPVLDIRVRFEGKEIAGLGVFQRLHPGDSEPTAHPNIWVDEEHRRKGIATAMYAEVRRRWPGVPIEHSEHASDAAKALNRTLDPRVHRTEKTAGAAGDLPEGLTFEVTPDRGTEGRGVIGPGAMIEAKVDGEVIGGLAWFTAFVPGPMGHQRGQIEGVYVEEPYRRRGIATEMWRRAKEIEPRLHHSHALTDEGRAWSQAVGSKTALTLYRGEGSHERPSYYTQQSNEAGAWWTTDLASAQQYAKSTLDGKVYVIEVDESEVERRGLPQYRFIPDPEVRKRRRLYTGSKTAAYDGTLIARGLTVGTEGDDKVLAQKLLAGTVTAQDMIHLLERHDGRVGVWWGVMGTYGDLSDFEDHAFASEDLLLVNYIEPDEDWWGGEVQVVLVAKRPTRDGQPWDPEWHNPPEAGGLMGNSYLADNEQVELVEVRYNAGLGWKSLPAQGIRVTARKTAANGVWYHASPVKMEPGTALKAAETPRFTYQVPGKVYFTPDPWVALNHVKGLTKVLDGKAWLYRVEPIGDIQDDPEALEFGYLGAAYMADDAVVLERYGVEEADALRRIVETPQQRYLPRAAHLASQPQTYYHVTSYRNWPDIRDNGLRPGADGHVWLFTETEPAMRFKDAWDSSGWTTGVPPEQWKVPPCIIVIRTDRAVPTAAGIPGAYWVEGPVAKDEVYDVIRPGDLHHYARLETVP